MLNICEEIIDLLCLLLDFLIFLLFIYLQIIIYLLQNIIDLLLNLTYLNIKNIENFHFTQNLKIEIQLYFIFLIIIIINQVAFILYINIREIYLKISNFLTFTYAFYWLFHPHNVIF